MSDLEILPLAWSGDLIDRAAHRRDEDLLPQLLKSPQTRVMDVAHGRVQVLGSQLRLRAPSGADTDRLGIFLGQADGVDYLAVDGSADPSLPTDPAGLTSDWLPLRAAALELSPLASGLVAQAIALINWHLAHPCCARCGGPTEPRRAGYERACLADDSRHYPRSDPAVIMTVVDDQDRVLLGRHGSWPTGKFSTLAGFVEPGESLEAAVRREVFEEAGVRVGRVEYRGSQPWPFPASLMVGFCAWATDPAITVDGIEIAHAQWFSRAELRAGLVSGRLSTSSRVSVSRHLIEHWYGGPLPEPGV